MLCVHLSYNYALLLSVKILFFGTGWLFTGFWVLDLLHICFLSVTQFLFSLCSCQCSHLWVNNNLSWSQKGHDTLMKLKRRWRFLYFSVLSLDKTQEVWIKKTNRKMYLGAGWRSGKLACTAQQGTWEVKQFIHNFLHGTSYSLFQMIARKMKLMRSKVWYLWICSWMLEIHHKQAEVVVSRVLSEKLLLKNKTLANEYKKLKVWKLAITLLQFDIVLQTCECCSLCLCHSSKIKLLINKESGLI